MMWMTADEHRLAECVVRLAYANPFLGERIECEREILGGDHAAGRRFWHMDQGSAHVGAIQERVEPLVEALGRKLGDGARVPAEELRLYRDVVLYWLYIRYQDEFLELLERPDHGTRRVAVYRRFAADFERAAELAGGFEGEMGVGHIFAFLFQVRRAFQLIFRQIFGGSMPAAQLRASVWQSVFTHDLRRYRRSLFRRMGDVTTLITGPSGTGKELVARAVGFSRYIPFDTSKEAFSEDFESSFYPLNLSALSPTLIESELFGHLRGAFTGALEDRPGWLEACPPLGTIFLDEIGEVDPAIQVKLLRVLETRTFQRLGDTEDRRFQGKIVAATNRDPAREMRTGTLRQDFYYRLCSDLIETPSLEEQIRDAPEEFGHLIEKLALKVAGADEAPDLTRQSLGWIRRQLGPSYTWPGNVRELEQCVRNIMIRGRYEPQHASADAPREQLEEVLEECGLSLPELEARYVETVYASTGSYQAAARRLGIDRRTVKAKMIARARRRAG
jgi:transcriptional regulator with AAA-type ATPase domain